ncbi:MAG: trypsin-like peptidase domain-containing protein [Bacteroidales bacterium]|nr:trypsin-like peptidase domain-containing protein [Bacteroidales bacterium]
MKKLLAVTLISLIAITTGLTQNLSTLFEEVKGSVVVIHILSKQNTGLGNPYQRTEFGGLGSGFLVSEDGFVVTAAHVVNDAAEIMVTFKDGQKIPARVTQLANQADVALIKLQSPPKNPIVAKIGDSDSVKVGDPVFVIGAPMGLEYSLSYGIISGRHKIHKMTNSFTEAEFFQTDAAINTGNSGGPVFNMKGEVIGIASSILTRSGGFEGIGFAATTEIARQLLVDKPSYWWGITPVLLDDELAGIFNLPQSAGILVENVTDKSPAYFAGIKGGYMTIQIGETEFLAGGDIILAIEDIPVTSEENLAKISDFVIDLPDKTPFNVKILRKGKVQNIRWFK